jgi:protein SCO1/2
VQRLGRLACFLILLLASACATAGVTGTTSRFEGTELITPVPKPEFVLTDTSENPFDFQADTAGKLTFLYFGYTFCPDVCPVQMAQLAAVLSQLPDVERNAIVVFVTVDPERDTPAVIRAFLDKFDPDFVGLSGTVQQVQDAQRAAGVPVAVKIGQGPDYSMGHAGQVLVYTPGGFAYTQYPYGTRQTQWAHDLPILLGQ